MKIRITGEAASGKTRVAQFLAKSMANDGYAVTLIDDGAEIMRTTEENRGRPVRIEVSEREPEIPNVWKADPEAETEYAAFLEKQSAGPYGHPTRPLVMTAPMAAKLVRQMADRHTEHSTRRDALEKCASLLETMCVRRLVPPGEAVAQNFTVVGEEQSTDLGVLDADLPDFTYAPSETPDVAKVIGDLVNAVENAPDLRTVTGVSGSPASGFVPSVERDVAAFGDFVDAYNAREGKPPEIVATLTAPDGKVIAHGPVTICLHTERLDDPSVVASTFTEAMRRIGEFPKRTQTRGTADGWTREVPIEESPTRADRALARPAAPEVPTVTGQAVMADAFATEAAEAWGAENRGGVRIPESLRELARAVIETDTAAVLAASAADRAKRAHEDALVAYNVAKGDLIADIEAEIFARD